ncbi:MAG TPA: hypothetical protein VGA56_05930 [Opitutaceae bacterium]
MKLLALIFLLLLGIAAGALYAFRDRLAGRVIERGLDRLATLATARGVQLRDIQFADATLTGFGAVAAGKVRGEVMMKRGLVNPGQEALFFEAERISVSAEDLLRGRILVTVLGGLVVVLDPSGQPTGQQVTDLHGSVEFTLAWRHLEDSVLLVEEQIRRLLREGTFHLPARISGEAQFQILGKWHDVTVTSRAENGVTGLLLDVEDVREIAKAYLLPLTDAEVDLVARNPVRAPALLRISQQAYASAQAYRRSEPGYPYDAYRHVYWSWLLTREFGTEFSEQVTDAHEIRPTYETSAASRRMDLNNNAVGRAYALANVPEGEIHRRVLTDPNIIRRER